MFIYLITDQVNGWRYIGMTSMTISRRWSRHKYRARNGGRSPLHCAMRSHGFDNFKVKIVGKAKSRKALCQLEKKLIEKFKTLIEFKQGYNLTTGGDGGATFTGRKHSPETIRKMKANTQSGLLEWKNPFRKINCEDEKVSKGSFCFAGVS